MSEHYDAVIVGSGAGGGTLAHSLAQAGKSVLILERGGWLPKERENWDPAKVFIDGRYVSRDTWYDADGKPFQPQAHYFVGGATKMYGAALFRLRYDDFSEVRHIDGTSPAWPLTYDELEPWYSAAEWLYRVHGNAGEDPTEPWRSRQYQYPAVTHEPRIAEISKGLARKGYHPFHAPSGVMLNEGFGGRVLPWAGSPCQKCATCDGHPCMVGAKSDAESISVRPIMDMPNVTILTGAEVRSLVTDSVGRTVTGVIVERNGNVETYSGDVVVLSAGAANSARILLRSGLANGSDQVGRNYMCHNSRAVVAIDAEPNHTRFQKTLAIHDFYWPGMASQWPLGSIQMVGKSNAANMKGESWLASLAPGMALSEVAAHSVDFWLTTEDLPQPDNRVTVDTDGAIHLAYRSTNDAESAGLYRELRTIMHHIGIKSHGVVPRAYMGKTMPLAAVAHQAGTCRFGDDPATSVLDRNCRTWQHPNLFVVDASFMPSIGATNPALTIFANALRVADYIATEVL